MTHFNFIIVFQTYTLQLLNALKFDKHPYIEAFCILVKCQITNIINFTKAILFDKHHIHKLEYFFILHFPFISGINFNFTHGILNQLYQIRYRQHKINVITQLQIMF